MSEEAKVQGYTKDKLYELVPAIYRQLDAKSDRPLEALLSIIARQVGVLEEDIAGLYDNWFIETCDEWVTAYIADLVGAKSLVTSKVSSSLEAAEVSQRAYVANTIAYRRRKGTLAVLEQLAEDTTQWDSHAVEFFQLLGTTQHLNHLRPENHRTPDLRDTNALELLNTPFDKIAHTVEVRRIASGRGYYNIPNIGIFLWRLQAFSSQDTPAFSLDGQKFTFHPLSYDEPIFNTPDTEAGITGISGETNVSVPIRIRALYDNLRDYYGRSLAVTVRYADNLEEVEIPAKDIEVCNLTSWRKPADGKVAVDPTLGRIRLSKDATQVRVVYYYGFSGKVGGGFYTRQESELASGATYKVSGLQAFVWSDVPGSAGEMDWLRAMLRNDYGIDWLEPGTAFANDGSKITASQGEHSLSIALGTGNETAYLNSDGIVVATLYPREVDGKIYVSQHRDIYASVNEAVFWWEKNRDPSAVIEVIDSEVYKNEIAITLPAGSVLEIRAGQEERPILKSLRVRGEKASKLVLDGLWLDDPSTILKVEPGDMESIRIRHCTLVPARDAPGARLAIDLENYVRRHLCSWDNVEQDAESKKLQEFLHEKLGLDWVAEGAQFEKHDDSGTEYVAYKKDNDELRIELDSDDSEESTATLKTKGEGDWKKVYEFSVLTQSGKKVMYLEGGNDSLQIELERSICGRINTLNSPVFTWSKVPEDAAQSKYLREFLTANFNLDWLSDTTPFVRTGDKLEAASADSSHSLTFTLDSAAKRATFAIDGKVAQEFLAVGEKVYCQSDAKISATDSIIDGKGKEAISSRSATIKQCTVFGRTRVDELALASNSIFTDTVRAKMDQKGCVRFSYVPAGSKTPRRYKCQPGESSLGVEPRFTSELYGDPGYAQLHKKVDAEIFEGADNGAEMGAFNHLLQAHRISDLKSALEEYLRFGLEAGVFLVT